MTQEEYIDYLKGKAKALEMDYVKMLERRAYLKYQVKHIGKGRDLVKPYTPPRYDDVFFKGVEQLDKQ